MGITNPEFFSPGLQIRINDKKFKLNEAIGLICNIFLKLY